MTVRLRILSILAAAAIIAMATTANSQIGSPLLGGPATAGGLRLVAEIGRCTARPVEEITLATLNNAPIVTLTANGQPVVLLLDTGAERTVFTPATVKRLGAQPPRIEFQRQIHGFVGAVPSREVELSSFVIGNTAVAWRRMAVAPITAPVVFSVPLDGLLGADVLSDFDLDIDFPRHRLGFYQKGACTDPPWNRPYTRIATGRSRNQYLFFPVELDHHRLTAIIDSGAQRSFVSEAAAQRVGVPQANLAQDQLVTAQAATAARVNLRIHRFTELKLGAETIQQPQLLVGPGNFRDADVVLGMDLMKSRRIWFSYGSRQVLLSR